jgi:hypothetical protein
MRFDELGCDGAINALLGRRGCGLAVCGAGEEGQNGCIGLRASVGVDFHSNPIITAFFAALPLRLELTTSPLPRAKIGSQVRNAS